MKNTPQHRHSISVFAVNPDNDAETLHIMTTSPNTEITLELIAILGEMFSPAMMCICVLWCEKNGERVILNQTAFSDDRARDERIAHQVMGLEYEPSSSPTFDGSPIVGRLPDIAS